MHLEQAVDLAIDSGSPGVSYAHAVRIADALVQGSLVPHALQRPVRISSGLPCAGCWPHCMTQGNGCRLGLAVQGHAHVRAHEKPGWWTAASNLVPAVWMCRRIWLHPKRTGRKLQAMEGKALPGWCSS